ncbi:unnamed protein product [Arabidopsis arenosa]|uniref:CCHC-type domain-containing protein n=1 Tax=Arabidopsis arenosa TaxID=38785 RepID=A0A8S2AY73_ARAAE|nr:unnamed protein product [Arabidopsis arenosa]
MVRTGASKISISSTELFGIEDIIPPSSRGPVSLSRVLCSATFRDGNREISRSSAGTLGPASAFHCDNFEKLAYKIGRGRGSRGGRNSSPPLDRFEYRPILQASFSELSQWNAEAGPSVPALDREISPFPSRKVAEQSTLDSETGPREDGDGSDLWEDYLILPDSPDSTLPGFGTIINPVVVSDVEDQVVPNEPVISPMVPSFDYPSLPDDPLAAFLRENDTIRRGETPRADTEALVTPTPAQWKPYCYTCGEVDHYPRWCQFYRPYEDPVIRCTLCNEVGHYASECPMVMVGPSDATTRQIAPATTQASTSTVVEDYWSRVGCPCRKCRYRYE